MLDIQSWEAEGLPWISVTSLPGVYQTPAKDTGHSVLVLIPRASRPEAESENSWLGSPAPSASQQTRTVFLQGRAPHFQTGALPAQALSSGPSVCLVFSLTELQHYVDQC